MHNLFRSIDRGPVRRGVRYACAALVALGVLFIFLCPLPKGPFQVTHGPATALRASRAALLVFLAMAAVSGLPLPIILASLFLQLFLASLQSECGRDARLPAEEPAGIPCALRC